MHTQHDVFGSYKKTGAYTSNITYRIAFLQSLNYEFTWNIWMGKYG